MHSKDPFSFCLIAFPSDHGIIIPVIDLALYDGISIICHLQKCRYSIRKFLFIVFHTLCFLFFRKISGRQKRNSTVQLFLKIKMFFIFNDQFCVIRIWSIGMCIKGHLSQHHFRVSAKILIDRNTIICIGYIHPILWCISSQQPSFFLEENDIWRNFGTCVLFEGDSRQTHRANKVCTFRYIFTDYRISLIHSEFCRHYCYHPPWTDQVYGFCQKIIMYPKTILFIFWVKNLVSAKWHISHNDIKLVFFKLCFLETFHLNSCVRMKLLCNPSTDTVQFNSVKLWVSHIFWQYAVKISDSHTGFQDWAALESELLQRLINHLCHNRRGIKSRINACSCLLIFFFCQQLLQFLVFICPIGAFGVERIGKTTPAHIPGQDNLFFWCCRPGWLLQLLQQLYSCHVAFVLCFITRRYFPGIRIKKIRSLADALVSVLHFLI